jgi:hypothetical protein
VQQPARTVSNRSTPEIVPPDPLDLHAHRRVYGDRVSTSYQIKDVVDRSGFTAAALRNYEEIGLLPESSRSPAVWETISVAIVGGGQPCE